MPDAPDETAAARILDLFGAAGVRTAFGLPGVHNLSFWRASPTAARPRILSVRHEQTTVYAADGLARATGGLGVALTTTGPGAANAVAAFGEAAVSHSPVVLVASEAPLRVRRPGVGRGALHEMPDQSALFTPLAKAVLSATDADEAVAMAADALLLARTAPAGPVYLGVPSDVLGDAAEPGPRVREPVRTAPDLRAVEAAAALLASIRKVVIWAGGGCVASGAEQAVTDLAWRLGAPVITTYAARGLLGVDHPLLVDAPPHEPSVSALIADADLLLVVGSQLDGMATRNWSMPRPPLLMRVDVDERTAYQGWPPDAVVVGDAALVCDALATRVAPREPWADQVFRVRHALHAQLAGRPTHDRSSRDARQRGPGLAGRWRRASATWPWPATGSVGMRPCRGAGACSTRSVGGRSATHCPPPSVPPPGQDARCSPSPGTAGSRSRSASSRPWPRRTCP